MNFNGFAALYTSATIFAFTTLFVKLASRSYSVYLVSASRFVVGIVLGLIILYSRYGGIKIVNKKAVVLRGIFGAFSMIMTYAAISLTGPGRAALLSNIYPLFVPVFATLFFRERFQRRTIGSLILCTAGAVLVIRDGSGAALAGDVIALGSCFIAAIAVNFVRLASKTDNPFVIYMSPCVFGLPLALFAPLPSGPVPAAGTFFLAAAGLGAFIAHSMMNHGYKTVPAGRGSLVFFWETALTVVLGALVAGERFNLRFAFGLAFIMVGLWLNSRGKASSQEPVPTSVKQVS